MTNRTILILSLTLTAGIAAYSYRDQLAAYAPQASGATKPKLKPVADAEVADPRIINTSARPSRQVGASIPQLGNGRPEECDYCGQGRAGRDIIVIQPPKGGTNEGN